MVQSTDKNFMVPVGGAVIAASKFDTSLVVAVNKVTDHALDCIIHSCLGV